MKPWQNLTDLFEAKDVNTEMVKKYRNTHLCIDTGDKEFYAIYKGYENGYHKFADEFGGEIQLTNTTDCNVTIPTVKSGLYNTPHGVVLLTHNPYRQYRKGLCADRINCMLLTNLFTNTYADNEYSQVIFHILKNQFVRMSLKEVFIKLEFNRIVAINCDYAIAHSLVHETGFDLLYRDFRVGSIDKDVITVDSKLFLQEIYDTKHLWCPTHEVRLNG
jgi:hypothetical protein